jgi:hypothetical protein
MHNIKEEEEEEKPTHRNMSLAQSSVESFWATDT